MVDVYPVNYLRARYDVRRSIFQWRLSVSLCVCVSLRATTADQ